MCANEKIFDSFSLRAFGIVLVVTCVVAGLASWLLKLNFWIVAVIVFMAILVNGLVAAHEGNDKQSDDKE